MVATTGGGNTPFTLPTLAEIRVDVAEGAQDRIVGICSDPTHCLIAEQVRLVLPDSSYDVGVVPSSRGATHGYLHLYRENDETLRVQLPAELNKLGLAFDAAAHERVRDGRYVALTAAETLPIIDRVIAEVGQ